MFSEAEVRILFSVPAEYYAYYPGDYPGEQGLWMFTWCDSDIKVDLRTWKCTASYLAYNHNVGHYFAEADWPAEKSAA